MQCLAGMLVGAGAYMVSLSAGAIAASWSAAASTFGQVLFGLLIVGLVALPMTVSLTADVVRARAQPEWYRAGLPGLRGRLLTHWLVRGCLFMMVTSLAFEASRTGLAGFQPHPFYIGFGVGLTCFSALTMPHFARGDFSRMEALAKSMSDTAEAPR